MVSDNTDGGCREALEMLLRHIHTCCLLLCLFWSQNCYSYPHSVFTRGCHVIIPSYTRLNQFNWAKNLEIYFSFWQDNKSCFDIEIFLCNYSDTFLYPSSIAINSHEMSLTWESLAPCYFFSSNSLTQANK